MEGLRKAVSRFKSFVSIRYGQRLSGFGPYRVKVREGDFAPDGRYVYDASPMTLSHARKDAESGVNRAPEVGSMQFSQMERSAVAKLV
jgi:hypothetical protein